MAYICERCGNLNWLLFDGMVYLCSITFNKEDNYVEEVEIENWLIGEREEDVICPSCHSKELLLYDETCLTKEDLENLKSLSGAKLRIQFLSEKGAFEGWCKCQRYQKEE